MIFLCVCAAVIAVVIMGAVKLWKAFGPCSEFFGEAEWDPCSPYSPVEGE